MPEVKVRQKLSTATTPPKRDPVMPGNYSALIVEAIIRTTRPVPGQQPLECINVSYRLVKNLDTGDETIAGRRVFQEYVLEANPANPENSAFQAFRIRQMLDATGIPYDGDDEKGYSFNTDHLINKAVKIYVSQNAGRKPDATTGAVPIFNNVDRVDTMAEISPENVI